MAAGTSRGRALVARTRASLQGVRQPNGSPRGRRVSGSEPPKKEPTRAQRESGGGRQAKRTREQAVGAIHRQHGARLLRHPRVRARLCIGKVGPKNHTMQRAPTRRNTLSPPVRRPVASPVARAVWWVDEGRVSLTRGGGGDGRVHPACGAPDRGCHLRRRVEESRFCVGAWHHHLDSPS